MTVSRHEIPPRVPRETRRKKAHDGRGSRANSSMPPKSGCSISGSKTAARNWVHETFITDDTEQIVRRGGRGREAATAELAAQARRFDGLKLPDDVARKLKLLKLSVAIPAPRDPARAGRTFADQCFAERRLRQRQMVPGRPAGEMPLAERHRRTSWPTAATPRSCERAWEGWHAIAPPMRQRYARMVVLANQGAREMGFADVGAMWRSNYDMPPEHSRRSRPALAAGTPAIRFAARLRALAAREEIWRRSRHGRRAHSARICSAICGRRIGRTSIRWSRRRTPIPATTSPKS